MDNLAHAFTGAIVGQAIAPEIEKPFKRRLMLASMSLANLPDIDLLLMSFGREVYRYHHRGFTHSFIGLCLMIPIGLFLFRLIMGKKFFESSPNFSLPKQLLLVVVQLVFSHFFLDYLTSFGTMLLYPLSMQRFSYPLMFIIDPLFWFITGFGCLACYAYQWKNTKQRFTSAVISLFLILCLWGFEWSFKLRSHFLVNKMQQQVVSYPMPLAPVLWNVILETGEQFEQYTVSFKNPRAPKVLAHALPEQSEQARKCTSLTDPAHRAHFDYYKQFAEIPYCRLIENGCKCVSLKYSIPALGPGAFGEQSFTSDGKKGQFIRSPRQKTWDRLKNLY